MGTCRIIKEGRRLVRFPDIGGNMGEESQQSNSATENKTELKELLLRGLAKLKVDLDSGFISLEEFESRKSKLMDDILGQV